MDATDPSRLTRVITPLKRTLLRAARGVEGLPDIPDAQIEILRILPVGTALSPGELASALQLSRSTVSNLVTAMLDAGLVTRRPAAHDRRSAEVAASARAIELLRRFDAASEVILQQALDLLDGDERAALEAALPALEHLQRALEEVSVPEGTAAQ